MYFYKGAVLSVSTLNVASRAPNGYQHPLAPIIAPEAPRMYFYKVAAISVTTLNVASRSPRGYQQPGLALSPQNPAKCISIRAPPSLLAL